MAGLIIKHVLASIDDPAAGPSYSVRGLAHAQARLGHSVSILALATWRANQQRPESVASDDLLEIERLPLVAGWFGKNLAHSPDLRASLKRDAYQADIIHGHGLWLMPNVYPGWAVSQNGVRAKLVAAPRGMLGEAALEFSKWKKAAFWGLIQRRAIGFASCLHATSEQEVEDIRRFGLRQPVAIVPNGITAPKVLRHRSEESRGRLVLSLGRIHPKKGLYQLIKAWSQVEARHEDWRLQIMGPSENGHAEELLGLAHSLGLKRVYIEPPVFGDTKTLVLSQADIFVLPSLSENFAMTVAESLAAGTPVISTKGAPWRGLNENKCGWWVDQGATSLAIAMEHAMSLSPGDLREMGRRGREWMLRDFSWDRAAGDMGDVYQWLHGRLNKPSFVYLD
ncbi:MAG: glycosyltransferase [Beijerinckiaceae bacterium]